MDKAKQAVNSILSKGGRHDTTVHESTAPAIQKETVQEHHREEQQVVRDREVHQDHHHTTVQPIRDQEVLPEQHHHNAVGVKHETHDHRDHSHTKDKLQQEAAQFQNESVRAPEKHHTSHAVPEVAGEHVHHHVHEKIQPVVHKQTIEPHVIHTTVPVHETHHNKAEHHGTSTLPAINMADFKNQGASLTGNVEKHDHFIGEPNSFHKVAQGHVGSSHNHGTTVAGVGSGHTQGQRTGDNITDTHHSATGGNHNSGSHGKPSLMDKLNPKIDADGDGKKGFMS